MTEDTTSSSGDMIEIKKELVKADAPGKAPLDQNETAGLMSGSWVCPPYNLWHLSILGELSTEIGPCCEAIVEGTLGHGYRLIPRSEANGEAISKEQLEAIAPERVEIVNWLSRVNRKQGIIDLLKQCLHDRLRTGNTFVEPTRTRSGRIAALYHVPAFQVRISAPEKEAHEVSPPVVERSPDGSWRISTSRRFSEYFRKYIRCGFAGTGMPDVHQTSTYRENPGLLAAQMVADVFATANVDRTWYKEFGDDRDYDASTGELNGKKDAHELIHFHSAATRGPYGLPPYIGNRLSILGDRRQEEINYTTLLNNNVPSIMILCSDGEITRDSADRLRSFWESNVRNNDNRSKCVIIEAKPFQDTNDEVVGRPKIVVEKLYDAQIRDQMFGEYSKRNRESIRRSFRLPEIMLGAAAGTDTSRQVIREKITFADDYIYQPLRNEFDAFVSDHLLPALGYANWVFRINSPNTTDPELLAAIARDFEKTGAMTPRRATAIAEEVLGKRLPSMSTEIDQDIPLTVTVMREQKAIDAAERKGGSKSKAGEANLADQTEPSQQVMGEG